MNISTQPVHTNVVVSRVYIADDRLIKVEYIDQIPASFYRQDAISHSGIRKSNIVELITKHHSCFSSQLAGLSRGAARQHIDRPFFPPFFCSAHPLEFMQACFSI